MKILKRLYYCPSETGKLKLEDFNIIGKKAFYKDKTTKKVYCSEQLKTIEESAFEESDIEVFSMTLKESDKLKNSENYYLTGDRKKEKKFLDSLPLTIQYHAFLNCEKLHTVILKGSSIEIENEAFTNCFNLRTVVLESDNITIRSNAFLGCKDVTFISPSNNNVECFCRENNFEFIENI